MLSLSALLSTPSYAGSGLGAETGPCLGPDCPSHYGPPAACRKLGAEGRDEAYSLVVGGHFHVLQGSEAEGRIFVGGDLVLRTRGYYNLVQVGAGACVVPPDADQASSPPHLVVGGQIQPVDPSAVLAVGQPNLRSTALIGGARVGAGQVQARGGVRYQTSPTPPPVDFNSLAQRSAYWATLAPTGTVRGQHPMVLQGDGQSALQVFKLSADLPSGGLRLKGIPPGATVLINHPGTPTVSLQFYDMTDPAGHGGFQFDTELTRRMLWNFPQASLVKLGGGAQWQGSVLVARGALYNALPGLNGRVLVAGDLTQDSQGSEFHNYDFKGELPDPPTDDPPATEPGHDTSPPEPPPEVPPEPPPESPPPGLMQAALNIQVRYDGDALRITDAPLLQIESQCERSGTQSVRITPPAAGWIEGLQTDESCLLVAKLERAAQLPRGWQWPSPQPGLWVGDNPRVITPDTNPVELLLQIRPVMNASLRVLPRYLGNHRAVQTHPRIELNLLCSHSGEQSLLLQAPQVAQSGLLQDGEACEVLARRITGAVLQEGHTLSLPDTGWWSPGSTLVAGDTPDPIPLDISILAASPGDESEPPPAPPPVPPSESGPSTLNSIPLLTPWGLLGLASGLGLLSLGTWMGPAIDRRKRRTASDKVNESRGCAGSSRPGSGPAAH